MLSQILDFIHNYFIKEAHTGHFRVVSGELSDVDFLLDGQYFYINGSVLNDGLYQYPASGLADEEFNGEIWAMAVPRELLQLADEIQNWVDKYGDAVNSPYSSESFGGYSYTKQTSVGSNSGNGNRNSVFGWKDVFKSRLYRWRKII